MCPPRVGVVAKRGSGRVMGRGSSTRNEGDASSWLRPPGRCNAVGVQRVRDRDRHSGDASIYSLKVFVIFTNKSKC